MERARPMCCTPSRNNKRHLPRRATRLSVSLRWPARAKTGKTASALRTSDLRSTDSTLRGVMAILVSAKNTQTTALRVRTGLTEHTCKGLGPVEAPTPRYTHDCARIFPFFFLQGLVLLYED